MIRLLALLAVSAAVAMPQRAFYPVSKHGGTYMYNFYLPPAPSSYPWAPAWAPDGDSIAISLHGSIWRVDPKTGDADEITYNRRYHSSPVFSPDGRWMVYTADEDNRRIQLEILNVET
ncbi:MAG: hypothetical protein GY953_47080, partial [bacterium]|nr:hypothetical protein [bacterium]